MLIDKIFMRQLHLQSTIFVAFFKTKSGELE
jgi:hypothetical protein